MKLIKFFYALVLLLILTLAYNEIRSNIISNKKLDCYNCNVIIIDLTVFRADHLAINGYFRNTTPNIDKFATRSFYFKNAISPSSWTLPSSISLFTSMYSFEHGVKNNYVRSREGKVIRANLKELNPGSVTMAEIFNKNGYSTAAFTGDAHFNKTYGLNNGFYVYYDEIEFGGFEITIPLALNWLEGHKTRKFFLFLQGYDTHGRYKMSLNPSRVYIDKNYRGKYSGTWQEQIQLRDLSVNGSSLNLSNEDKEFWISLYDTKLYDADQRLGTFFSQIEHLGILNNTIIIILGDHGEELFERGRIDHGFSLYEELLHVPLIISIPNLKNGRIIEQQVRTIDVMPTIIDLTKVNINDTAMKQMRGTSLVPIMGGQHLNLEAFSETDYQNQFFEKSIRKSNGLKLIYSIGTNKKELYNLNDDPKEKKDLIDKEPKIAYELEQELFEHFYGNQK